MAKKKAGKREAHGGDILSRLQGNMKRLQRDAEDLLSRSRKQAARLISRDQKRALERIVNQAKRLRSDLEKRAKQASRQIEAQSERLLVTIERETAKRLTPLLKRLDLPSRQEVQGLSRRLAQLEKRVRSSRPTSAKAALSPTEAAPASTALEAPAASND
jgi:polyhydroxyalkanoate synthesis regulator phasin